MRFRRQVQAAAEKLKIDQSPDASAMAAAWNRQRRERAFVPWCATMLRRVVRRVKS